MKEHYLSLARYWARTASNFHASGYHIMGALFERYAKEEEEKAAIYAE